MRRSRSQIRAAQIAALAAEQEAYEKSVSEAIKVAAFARCDAVEQLYELLDVQPERPIIREGKNGRYEVASDKDETKRTARLIETVTALLGDLSEAPSRPAKADDTHPDEVVSSERSMTSAAPFADASSTRSLGLHPTAA
ncbi:hypothetical protein JF531_01120 [Microbacterium esteraromaticum]|uniref:hypothetical protein n=1 Tax=Microbacterium esteraromaticum TaxID=57043 RepID=UPI001A90B321|nr:hypothetical protein [Microbacterium esteraromaticum]MBN8423120.1 hypothetical protein [Microbacterium esteraromaticum]